MSKWFADNKLALNLDKRNIVKFITNNSPQYPLSIGYSDKYIEEAYTQNSLAYKLISWFQS
jgi:hypothetical protein